MCPTASRPPSSPLAQPLDIRASLTDQSLLITGATGFVGKVLVEKILWSLPEVGRLFLLIRPSRGRSAAERLRTEILDAPLFARLRARHGDEFGSWIAEKVEVVQGDLGQERFGLDQTAYSALAAKIDRVVGNAATVTFDERLDLALELNAKGALRTLELARTAGNKPLVHVSTCFVSGRRDGTILEEVVAPSALDAAAALAALEETEEDLRQKGQEKDSAWVEAGAAVAQGLGFNDVYTLTKALGERLLSQERGAVPLAILRPAIVESAHREPIPGWIEAVRVSDPLLLAYGRGRTEEFPGFRGGRLEWVPVDHVAHAIIAALAALPESLDETTEEEVEPGAEVPVYQVGSARNPLRLGELMVYSHLGFEQHPMRDGEGAPIRVGEARLVEPEAYLQSLETRLRTVRKAGSLLPWRKAKLGLARRREERTLEHLLRLLSVYRPYLDHDARYDDRRTRELWDRLSAADRQDFPFDIEAVDWQDYVALSHIPGLVRFALRAETGAPVPVPEMERDPRRDILDQALTNAREASTLFDLFSATARAYPEVMAFQTCREGHWLRYSYTQAHTAVANVAWRLRERGIRAGDRVALWSSGCPEWVITTFAAHRLGAVTVPLDPQWPAAEIAQAARLVGAKLLCAAPHLLSTMQGNGNEEGPGCPVVPLAAPFVPEPYVPLFPGAGETGSGAGDGELASIIFTSGTTVAPKAVPLTHANYLANVRDLVPVMQLTRERLLSVLPIHHVFEQMVGLLVPMSGGATFSYVAEIKPAEISWMMQTTRPTVLVAVPRLLELLHGGIQKNVEAGGLKLKMIFKILFALSRRKDGATGHRLFAKVHQRFGGSLRRIATGGSALPPALGRSFQLMGFQVGEGYGMTETSPVLTVNPWNDLRFGSVGKPLPGVEVDLRSPAEGAEGLEPGSGEVWVRGGNVMGGYYENPEATTAVLREGWLNTGDIGYFDAEGYLHLCGRSKDVIVTSAGKNVYPEEVEARYRGLPGVGELVILGLPRERGGEKVTALVVPAPGVEEESIRAAFAERSREVPSYQQIAGLVIWRGDLPKTTTMKVKRAVLREAVLSGERGGGDSVAAPAPVEVAWSSRQQEVIDTLARLARVRPDLLNAGDRLADLGVDSLTRVELVGELEGRFGVRLDDDTAASLDKVEDLFDLAT